MRDVNKSEKASQNLCGVLEVRVGAAGAVDTHILGHGDVGAAVGLRHDRHHRHSACSAHGLGLDVRQELGLVIRGHGGNDVHKLGDVS